VSGQQNQGQVLLEEDGALSLSEEIDESASGLAIVGMAGRFPGARDIDEFWRNLQAGAECITFFSEEELISSGVDPDLLKNPNYVRAKGVLADIDLFDAAFFGFSPREAEITDPQQRIFLECAWSALENAGYDAESYPGKIGVYAGAGWSSYLLFNLASDQTLLQSEAGHQILLGNDKDNLTTRVSYKLNLKGPSFAVQTGCSTSLVATSLACQGLLSYQCDMALAGGVSITVPQTGYLHQTGGIFSPDGHCRAFDSKAQGTVVSSGVGIVVLKRLEDAIADGDNIYAVIRAAAINNDGALKAGYTAPSIEGQAEVIVEAHAMADITAETITYVEAHGTATVLGDPIEVAALTRAFRASTTKKGFCAIGSVKTNIGHLDAAAGIAGLIKTTLALKHKQIPPSLHFESWNPEIDFANSPFYLQTSLADWDTECVPRRAGVSSFGLGGTNAHVIMEEAPVIEPAKHEGSHNLLLLSAKTSESLENATTNLIHHLKQHPEIDLADVAYTLQVGRKAFEHRRMLVCNSNDDAVRALDAGDPHRVFTRLSKPGARRVAFMFSGQGAQYVNMARGLYQAEPSFRTYADICFELLVTHENLDLRNILFPIEKQSDATTRRLRRTENAQPALFVIEYALAQMWMSWGINMDAAIGHSVGEYVAATIAGVFSLADALALVTLRGRLMQELPTGAMLAVPLPEQDVLPMLESDLSVAAINEPSSCVVSGSKAAIKALRRQLVAQGITCQELHTSHAFHSRMMEPILSPFSERLKQVHLHPPRIPFISNVSGTWITAEEATDANYWVKHIRQPVCFADGLQKLLSADDYILLEVGPGRTLSQFAKRHPDKRAEQVVLSTLRHPEETESDLAFLLNTAGHLWLSGAALNWVAFSHHLKHRRLPLPTYPFDRKRYWIEPTPTTSSEQALPREAIAHEVWQALANAARMQGSAGIDEDERENFLVNKTCLDRLCLAYMNITLRRSGAFCHPGEKYSPQTLLQKCRVIPRYQQLVHRWLDVLLANHHLRLDEDGLLTDLLPCSAESLQRLVQETKLKCANTPYMVALIETCGRALADVLCGDQEPIELFTSVLDEEAGSIKSWFFLDAHYKTILRTSLQQVVKLLPLTTNLRILEIGGGTGIAAMELLPILPPVQTSYTFTDIQELFISQARRKFSQYPFVDFGSLNIEESPDEQGYSEQSFDVIIAVNVLHVVRSMDKAIEHVRSLLAPGGLLLIWEITRPALDFDITYGLLMNPLEDIGRNQGNPFLSTEQWREVLLAHGFFQAAIFPDDEVFGQHIVMAQAAATGSPRSSSAPPHPITPAFSSEVKTRDGNHVPQPSLLKKPDVGDWFNVQSWKRSCRPLPYEPAQERITPEGWLIFVDQYDLGDQLAKRIELQGRDVITVEAGSHFHRRGRSNYTIDPQQQNDYNLLFQELKAGNRLPIKIVHLWGVNPDTHFDLPGGAYDEAQFLGLYSLLFLAQAIGEHRLTESLEISIVSSNMLEVTGDEIIHPERALMLAPCKVIPLEYPNIRCRSVDVVIPEAGRRPDEKLVEQVLDELRTDTTDHVIAYRGPHRWVQTVEPVHLNRPKELAPRLKRNGVYLITGGLGKIGLTVAEHLARAVQARLILIGRSPFLPQERWDQWLATQSADDHRSRLMRKFREFEATGAEVLIATADVSNLEQMRAAIAQAEGRFGKIDGVIHAAGVLGDGAIQQKSLEDLKSVLAPKVAGTMVLDTIFRDAPLDIFILFSSLSAIKPGFGQVAYSAANNFLDAFASSQLARRHKFTCCISWDVWQGEGMAYDADTPLALRQLKEEDFRQRGICPDEGMDVLSRVLGSTLPHVLVSTSDYLNVLKTNDRDLPQLYLETLSKASRSSPKHSRPDLSNAYVRPQNDIEESLVEIWQELLGTAGIGINDDFFQLGGDSLIGTQLTTRIKASFGVKLPIRCVYDHPTIRSMSEAVEQALIAQTSPERLGDLLKQLEGRK
jgi:acyl transferase domain-containing protein/SAM-dependent methyltransferase/acyl carrier protein